ncbi:MAG: GNAT family N-acetyltransferase [Prolixibacteraceae bacterium]
MSPIELKRVTIADLQDLQLISRQTFQETFAAVNTKENLEKYLTDSFNDQKMTAEIENPDSEFYFALLNNQAVGYLKVNFGESQTDLNDEKAMELERIYVLKEFHGKKVGQVLFEKALQIAKQHDLEYIWLGVWEHNHKAKKFYQKNGFTEFDKHLFILGNDRQTDLLMKMDVRKK